MTQFKIDGEASLYYEHRAPKDARATFVFVNALTGSTDAWEAVVAPRLRAAGFGTLSWNFRGQAQSVYAPGTRLTPELIIDDLAALMGALKPARPILVGLSIGGLFAIRAHLKGAAAIGLVLLNTLRKPGLRLDWINAANARAMRLGGPDLLLDMNGPMLVNPALLAQWRPNRLKDAPYAPLAEDDPRISLMEESCAADWDVPYERLTTPTLALCGLADRVFYDAADVADLFARLPDGRRIDWPDCGHLVPMEHPERLAQTLAEFGDSLG